MKTWDLNKREEIEQPKEMKEFINEIIKVMKKHNLSISHEDKYGGFIIEKYNECNIKWFKNAMKNYWKKVKAMSHLRKKIDNYLWEANINIWCRFNPIINKNCLEFYEYEHGKEKHLFYYLYDKTKI